MANWLIARRLTKVGGGWHRCAEAVIDERPYLDDDAADAELQAIVSESDRPAPGRAEHNAINAPLEVVEGIGGSWNARTTDRMAR